MTKYILHEGWWIFRVSTVHVVLGWTEVRKYMYMCYSLGAKSQILPRNRLSIHPFADKVFFRRTEWVLVVTLICLWSWSCPKCSFQRLSCGPIRPKPSVEICTSFHGDTGMCRTQRGSPLLANKTTMGKMSCQTLLPAAPKSVDLVQSPV